MIHNENRAKWNTQIINVVNYLKIKQNINNTFSEQKHPQKQLHTTIFNLEYITKNSVSLYNENLSPHARHHVFEHNSLMSK